MWDHMAVQHMEAEMADETKNETPGDETFSWQGADTTDAGTEPEDGSPSTSERAKEWMAQLEEMIGNIAEQTAPVVKEVGAKAAELAAVAADKAGPMAQRAAGWIDDKSPGVAERARQLASDLRSSLPGSGGPVEPSATEGAEGPSVDTAPDEQADA